MRVLTILIALWAAWLPSVGVAGNLPAASAQPEAAALFVELVINGQENGHIVQVTQHGDALLIDSAALRGAGVAVEGEAAIDLAARGDLRARYEAATQRVVLDVPAALLPLRRISGERELEALEVSIDSGALFNYDLHLQTAGGRHSAALWTEQRLFGDMGTISNTGVVRIGGAGGRGYLRYDTSVRWIDERRMLTATAGDIITNGLPWTGSVRLGGAQIARSFRLRPDLVTAPLPRFAGQASVPSVIDVFVDGYRVQQADVAPGRFVLDGVPVVNGAGEARIVTTDAVGRQIATVIPFYVAAELLRPGLTDFSLEAGALRRAYGVSSFGYGRAAGSATVRHGLSDRLTVELHGEAAADLMLGGIGAIWSPGLFGAFRGALAVSRREGLTGTQIALGYTYAGRRFGIGIDHVARSHDFADLAAFDLSDWQGGTRSTRISGSASVHGLGSIGLGYVDNRLRDGSRVRLASASMSVPWGERVSSFVAVDYDMTRSALSAQIRIVLPLGGRTMASAGLDRRPDGRLIGQAGLARQMPSDGGFGYSANAALDDRAALAGQVSATWRARKFQIEAGAATNSGASSAWASLTGSLSLLDGQVFAANSLPGAFALVSTGMADVPVYYENQKIGVTDPEGRLFIPNVTPFRGSRFAVDAAALPIGAVATKAEIRAALREGTGAVLKMPVVTNRQAVVRLVDARGIPLEPGTTVATSSGVATVVGWDGVVMIENALPGVTLRAATASGACEATLPHAFDEPLADLGVARCE